MRSICLYFLLTVMPLLVLGCKKKPQSPAQPTDSNRPADRNADDEPPAFAVAVTGSGPPMILIPGLACGANVWTATVDHFKDRHQCHVLTLAGFAGQPPMKGEPFLERVRDALIKYIRDKKLHKPIIVGHSLGGFAAFWVAAVAPEDVGPIISVDGLPFLSAIMNPNATPESVRQQAEMVRAMYKAQTPGQFAIQIQQFLAAMITNTEDLKTVGEASAKSDPETVGQAFYELMTIDLRDEVKAIQTPVLLFGSTAAIPNPENKKQAEKNYRSQIAAIPTHKVIFAPKARHFIQLDEPEFFVREVEAFLREAK